MFSKPSGSSILFRGRLCYSELATVQLKQYQRLMMTTKTIQHRIIAFSILLGLSLLIFSLPASASEPTEHPNRPSQEGSSIPTTEEAIASTVIPARDLVDLALRLGGADDIPPPPTSPTRQYTVGEVDRFFIHGDFNVFTINATLEYMNDRVYMWVESGYEPEQATLRTIADRFQNEIYEPVRAVFGSESTPGVDGDPRIHILHSSQLGANVAGYFYSLHEYPIEAIDVSNQREMFFISTSMLNSSPDYYLSVLAHEFQHMIHFAVDANEESWMNEGLAELSAYEAGFGVSGFSSTYLSNTGVQLNHWPDGNTAPIYGGGFLFTAYLKERFGTEFIRALVANPANGMESVERTLADFNILDADTGLALQAETVFAQFSLATLLNDSRLEPGIYGYNDPELAALRQPRIVNYRELPGTINTQVNQWSSQYYQIAGDAVAGRTLEIRLDGDQSAQLLPEGAYSGQYAFWSNRANLSDTRLSRRFDLSDVDRATLGYHIWYDIEEGWDYAYVTVSADNGTTWDIIPTSRTTTENPFGTSYGSGYTGASNGWVQEIVDLSAYAGKEIILRFEYITDDATLGNGMLIDDVTIPEINFFDDFEGDISGWTVEGWLRTDNVLNQTYTLYLLSRLSNGSVQVKPLVTANDRLPITMSLPVDTEVSDLTFALSAYAAVTIQPASVRLTIEAN